MTWTPSEEALAFTRTAFEDLGAPDLAGICSIDSFIDDPWLDIYWEAVSGLGAFMREARFHIALASLYLADASVRGDAEDPGPPDNGDPSELRVVGLPASVMAFIMSASPAIPVPEDILLDPYQHAVGGATAGKWWASSLLDSAILRLVFAADRIAAALWALHSHTRAAPAPTTATRWPRFLNDRLTGWADLYSTAHSDAWTELLDRSRSDTWTVLQEWRHGLVHRTRPVSEIQFPTMTQYPFRTVTANASEDAHWGIAGGGYWWARDLIGHTSTLVEASVTTPSPLEEK